jgi:chromosome partitioning protein
MARVHVIANQKGGVGKTTVTVNLAAVVADTLGGRVDAPPVLGVSTDPQASMLEWAQRVGDALPFDFEQCHDNPALLGKLREIKQYSHIFVDTPGSLEDESILRAVLTQADDVIVPLEPEPMSFSPATRSIQKVIEPAGVPWRVLLNNWDPRDGDADLNQTRAYVEARGWPSFHTVIRHYKLHTRASAEGVTVVQYAKNRVALEARQDFFKLALEVLGNDGRAPRHSIRAEHPGQDGDHAGNAVSSGAGGVA